MYCTLVLKSEEKCMEMQIILREIEEDETMRAALVTKSSLLGLQASHGLFPAYIYHTLS